MPNQALRPLQREVRSLRDDYPALSEDDLFVLWFLLAFVTDQPAVAADALTGKSGEKGIDAVVIDDPAKLVTLVQAKYRQSLGGTAEKRSEIIPFASLAGTLADDEAYETFAQDLEPTAHERVEEARERLLQRGYRLNLHFVTTGRCSKRLAREAERITRKTSFGAGHPAKLTILGGKETLDLLSEYLAGVAPPVPALDLIVDGDVSNQYDSATETESWVFPMNGRDLADAFTEAGVRIFARNIRGHLGANIKINKSIRETIDKDPRNFLYLNNGVTIICTEGELTGAKGVDLLHVTNPQIINGQQTTYALKETGGSAAHAQVFVRVIQVPKEGPLGSSHYETMVDNIVAATNSQNAIDPSDLRSNDTRQVELAREFQRLGYYYVRKKGQTGRSVGANYQWTVRMKEAAKAAKGCQDAVFTRNKSVQLLFEEESRYKEIFSKTPRYILSCWWLSRLVDGVARGTGDWSWSKPVVLQYLWTNHGTEITRRQRRFLEMCELEGQGFEDLRRAIKRLLEGSVRYYNLKKGKGDERQEMSAFFKSRDVYEGFETFMRSQAGKSYRTKYKRAIDRFSEGLELETEDG